MNKLEAMGLSRLLRHLQTSAVGTISAYREYRKDVYVDFALNIAEQKKENNGDWVDLSLISGTEDYLMPLNENKARHKALGVDLINLTRSCKGGFKSIMGVYPESGKKAQTEQSYIVWAHPDYEKRFKKGLIELGTLYEQDSITFQEFGGDFKLISTSPKFINANNCNIGTELLTWRNVSFTEYDYEKVTDEKGELQYIQKSLCLFMSELNGKPFKWTNWGKEDWESVPADIEIRGKKLVSNFKGSGDKFNSIMLKGAMKDRYEALLIALKNCGRELPSGDFERKIFAYENDKAGSLVVDKSLINTSFNWTENIKGSYQYNKNVGEASNMISSILANYYLDLEKGKS